MDEHNQNDSAIPSNDTVNEDIKTDTKKIEDNGQSSQKKLFQFTKSIFF